jgi:hypothetical protein
LGELSREIRLKGVQRRGYGTWTLTANAKWPGCCHAALPAQERTIHHKHLDSGQLTPVMEACDIDFGRPLAAPDAAQYLGSDQPRKADTNDAIDSDILPVRATSRAISGRLSIAFLNRTLPCIAQGCTWLDLVTGIHVPDACVGFMCCAY